MDWAAPCLRNLGSGSQSPHPLWDRPALPTSSAWLEKVVSEALGHGKPSRGRETNWDTGKATG